MCSVNVVVDGTSVAVCYASSLSSKKYGQSLRTALGSDHWGIRTLGGRAEGVVEQLWKSAEETGLFAREGNFIDLRCPIDRAFTDSEVDILIAWCESVAQAIRKCAGMPVAHG